jgi:hypothetical protein
MHQASIVLVALRGCELVCHPKGRKERRSGYLELKDKVKED